MNSDTRDAIYEDNAQERREAALRARSRPQTRMINLADGLWLRADAITSVISRSPTLSEKAKVEIRYGNEKISLSAESRSHANAMADSIASLI